MFFVSVGGIWVSHPDGRNIDARKPPIGVPAQCSCERERVEGGEVHSPTLVATRNNTPASLHSITMESTATLVSAKRFKQEAKKPGTDEPCSWLHGFLLNYFAPLPNLRAHLGRAPHRIALLDSERVEERLLINQGTNRSKVTGSMRTA